MELKIISSLGVSTLKQNKAQEIKFYGRNTSEMLLKNLEKATHETNSLIGTAYTCENFKLIESNNEKDDFKNVKILYDALGNVLNPSLATDERLWVGLELGPFWKYTSTRWKRGGWTEDSLTERFFCGSGTRRGLLRNSLSRLWWIGYLTYDENLEDHYKYTRFVCSSQRFIVDILERNISENPQIIKTCIDTMMRYQADHSNIQIDTNAMREIQKYVSILGGTYLLDSMDMQELSNKIYSETDKVISRKNIQK